MPLLGAAALAMWWDVPADARAEFEDWHTHEHVPERLGLPGFRRATRWSSGTVDGAYFVLYELETYETLFSAQYLARLNAPTPWSTKMMPHHRNMVRSQCHVLKSCGGTVAQRTLTIRLAPAPGHNATLSDALAIRIERYASRPGLVGAHLLKHERPAIAATVEQRIRGGDREADWIIVVSGYDAHTLAELAASDLAATALADAGAEAEVLTDIYTLCYSATPPDVTVSR
jgi:hypothetical protein